MSRLQQFEASLSEPYDSEALKPRLTRTQRTKSAESIYTRVDGHSDVSHINYNSDHTSDSHSSIHRDESEIGYRADFDGSEEQKPITPDPEGSPHGGKIKRSLSVKFRRENKIEATPLPIDDTLHKALRQGTTPKQLCKMLRRVAHIDQTDTKGQSALHICAARGLIESARALLKRGANINLQDSAGFTPLHCSVLEKQILTSKFLLEHKHIDVTITNNEQSNALHYLVRIPVTEDNVVAYRSVLDLLVQKGINIDAKNKHNEAPIHFACMTGNVHAVGFLLERGADCNLRTLLGETPLHYAIRTASIKLVRLLMENGADPTAKAVDGSTPVDVAEQYQCTDVLDCLQSIIEEELDEHHFELKLASKNNDCTRAGWLHIYQDGNWDLCWTTLNTQRILCNRDDSKTSATIAELSLSFCELLPDLIEMDHKQSGEKLFCFSVCERAINTFVFGTKTPEERSGWFSVLSSMLISRKKLNNLYDKLKLLSKPRLRLRARERTIAYHNTQEGLRVLTAAVNCKLKDELLRLIVQATDLSAAALSEVVNYDDEVFVRHLVKFFMHHGVLMNFLKEAITHDIRKITMGETMFREMSLSTRMLSIYLEMEDGREYLRSTVLGLLTTISSLEHSMEVSPNSAFGNKINIKANHDKILEISQTFLDQVLSSASRVPIVFRELLYHTKERVDRVFPNMTHAVIGGFVFLRFLCPAIVSPQKYGLVQKPLDNNSLRVCVLLTKLLQSVSNGVEFDGSKEDYMQRLNPFIKKNRLYVNVFFDNLTQIDFNNLEALKANSQINKALTKEELATTETFIYNHILEQAPKMAGLLHKDSVSRTQAVEDSDDDNSAVEADDM